MMSELLLLSGGIDSICLAAWCRPACCLTIDYGQLSAGAEFTASEQVCKALGLKHTTLKIPIERLGCGTMIGDAPISASPHAEFWPFRNQFLITLGAMYALRFGHTKVLIGTVLSDRRHADGHPSFVKGIADVVRAQEGAIEVEAPALQHGTVELIELSGVTSDVLGWAHSCHSGGIACGQCPGCRKHSEVMAEIGWNR
ncbi:MAG: 7-cyano-7-deazaguanine synthase [Humidesulfovibrio sp.]